MFSQDLTDIFSPDGPIARAVPGFHPRQAQLELALAVEQAIRDCSTLVAEAGTGTGKTWAYLVPAFFCGGKVLVSTGTRTLQDQLFSRDLPRLRKALALPIQVALLKGRSNYVCHYHLERLQEDDRGLRSRSEVAQLRKITVFARNSKSGDRSELADIPEDADIWGRVTSTRDTCLGQDCPNLRDCFVMKARRQAQEADLVVVNHALFMADLALREEGITDLLPAADVVIFDEAHQLPDIATRFLGSSVSTHELIDLARSVQVAGLAHAREALNWADAASRLEHATRELRLTAAPIDKLPGRKATFQALPNAEDFDAALESVLEVLDFLIIALDVVAEKHPDLTAARRTALDLRARLFQWSQPDRQGHNALTSQTVLPAPAANDQVPVNKQKGQPAATDGGVGHSLTIDPVAITAEQAVLRESDEARIPQLLLETDAVRWVEFATHHIRLHSAPLSVARLFSSCQRKEQAWVLTSATLSVNGDFGHFLRQLGLSRAQTCRWESPFNYPDQGLLFVPASLPLPNAPGFNQQFVKTLFPLLRASSGGVLVLCTTLRAVDQLADLIEEALEDVGEQRVLLRQGQRSRRALLDQFRADGRAVLVGSASFWEGVDVPGDALTLVAIDKMPFAPPDDPVLEARLNACRQRGGNPFMEYQLPEAAIALKQGAGRLIRSESDRGVLMVGDTRMVDKPYGKLLWRGLPPFARTRDPEAARIFLEAGRQPAADPAGD